MMVSYLQYACMATMASLALLGLLALETRPPKPFLPGATGTLPLGVVALEVVAAIVDDIELLNK
jgi:hypothetical protein